ncbi:MAG: diguanylate cyclase [Lachnospiraceae bacterium]|nr:diguanylate cyclase [Lachnospiraceae bacterium]
MKKRQSKLFFSFATIMTVPILVLGIILVLVGQQSVAEGMAMEIQKSLAGTTRTVVDTHSLAYPGEIRMEDGHLYMGETDMTGNYTLVDRIKDNTGSDVSVFWGDTRILTTVTDESGKRIVGSKLEDPQIMNAVFAGNEYYSDHVDIRGEEYFGYYAPLYNGDEICGIVFAGMTKDSVETNVMTIVTKILVVFVLALVISLAAIYTYARGLVERLNGIRAYVGGLADNDFDAKMPQKVYKKQDEIAEMGTHAVEVAQTIKGLIYNDPLTGLYNRRAGRSELSGCIDKAELDKKWNVTVALGDIDYFKKVNDTYGHECGDMVLVTVSEMMKRYLEGKGICSRWGGEEFLLVYKCAPDEAEANLQQMMEELRQLTFTYEEYSFSVTMTFGLTQYKSGESIDGLIKKADDLLYRGKEEGRNRIVKVL